MLALEELDIEDAYEVDAGLPSFRRINSVAKRETSGVEPRYSARYSLISIEDSRIKQNWINAKSSVLLLFFVLRRFSCSTPQSVRLSPVFLLAVVDEEVEVDEGADDDDDDDDEVEEVEGLEAALEVEGLAVMSLFFASPASTSRWLWG